MERTKLWTRVGSWFKPSPGKSESYLETELIESEEDDADAVGTSLRNPVPSNTLFGRSRNNPQLDRLESEYARVAELIDSVQAHFEQQRDQADRMAGSLDRLAESLSFAPEASRAQLEALSAIKEQMSSDGTGLRRLEESIAQLPQIADAQRETMVGIARHLDDSRTTTAKVVETLDGFRESMVQVGDATNTTGRAIEKIRWDQAARDERLTAILQQQTKRLAGFTAAALVLAGVAAAVGVVALFRS